MLKKALKELQKAEAFLYEAEGKESDQGTAILVERALCHLEKACLIARETAAGPSEPVMLSSVADTGLKEEPVIAEVLADGCRFVFPRLIPLRRAAPVWKQYFAGLLTNALKNIPITRYHNRMTACFIHHYTTGKARYDADNLERKYLIDRISPYFLPDDDLSRLSHYTCGVLDTRDYTELYLIAEEAFPRLLEELKKWDDISLAKAPTACT